MQRMVWIDALRLAAGVSMVILHASADPRGAPWVDYAQAERVFPIILRTIAYSARTELFIIISVFLLLLSLEQRPRSYPAVVGQQLRRLMIPFVFWVLFYAVYNLLKANAFGYLPAQLEALYSPSAWIGFLVLGDVKYHMHFLPTLFCIVVFYPLFEQARKTPILAFAILACLMAKREIDLFVWSEFQGSEILPFLVRAVKVTTYLGYGLVAAAALGFLERTTTAQRRGWISLVAYAIFLLALIKVVAAYKTVVLATWPHNYTAGYWADFLMPVLLFLLCMLAGHLPWPKILTQLAPYSFGIYLCHPVFLDVAEIILMHSNSTPAAQMLFKIAAALPLTSLVVMLLAKSKHLAWTVGLGPFPLKLVQSKRPEKMGDENAV